MRFEFTAEENGFRRQVSAFLDEVLPDGWVGPVGDPDDEWAFSLKLRKELVKRGWLVMSWPKEYGGADSTPMMNTIFAEEMAYRRAPGLDGFGTRMLGPTLMRFGNDEQRTQHLGAIARGEVQWCQGYSEPNSGSDLASLQTRAVLDGDEFVINGAKIWTSIAHRADMMFILVRTNPDAPRHAGISLLLLDMKSTGIEIRPIMDMADVHHFNEVTFDNVRVPKANLVGDLNDGWRVGMTVLNHERSGIEFAAGARAALEELVDYINSDDSAVNSVKADPNIRTRLAELSTDVEAARLMCYDVTWRHGQGQEMSAEASMSKVAGTEVYQRVLDYGLEILGMYGSLEAGSAQAELQGRLLKLRMLSTATTIFSGTNEIQKNIIAQRGLGLPRAPRR
ncbi:MAG: acyl-CoA dehydrogenase family protein [Dehalococcoidia bacterium]|nr:acyl-CoA dehydrogenase family protein [Dehalococcoidia bacterium]